MTSTADPPLNSPNPSLDRSPESAPFEPSAYDAYSLEELEAALATKYAARVAELRVERRRIERMLAAIANDIALERGRDAEAGALAETARTIPRPLMQAKGPMGDATELRRAGMPSPIPFPVAPSDVTFEAPPSFVVPERTEREDALEKKAQRARPLAPMILKALAAAHPSPRNPAQLAAELKASASGENLETTIARALGRMAAAGSVIAWEDGGFSLTPDGMKRAGAG